MGLKTKLRFTLILISFFAVYGIMWFSFSDKGFKILSNLNIIARLTSRTDKYQTIFEKWLGEDIRLFDDFSNITESSLNISKIKQKIKEINNAEKIYNEDLYGSDPNYSLVIVVQVHNRITMLKYLIASLSAAKDISTVLLIFSHDIYDEQYNTIITTLRFCRIMQIYYPHSIQLYPNEFPGRNPKDCPPDMSIKDALPTGCSDAFYLDVNGLRRNPQLSQLKHHWWWKAHKLFSLRTLEKYNELVLFLEDDLYVVEDFIPVLKLMEKSKEKSCSFCKFLSLTTNLRAVTITVNGGFATTIIKAEISKQFSNIALAFTRKTWKEILACKYLFCTRDEYNWDHSLKHVFTNCMANTSAMTLLSPRVFHLGACGVHYKSTNCSIQKLLTNLQKAIADYKQQLYPINVSLVYNSDMDVSKTLYGRWADPRDHALCLNMTA